MKSPPDPDSLKQTTIHQTISIYAGLATLITTLIAAPVVGFILLMLVSYTIPVGFPFREVVSLIVWGSLVIVLMTAIYRVYCRMFNRKSTSPPPPSDKH